jgi:nucleotide-binding universal stress UspA family protein
MYSKILVPLDGSQLSEKVLSYARSLAKGLKVPVELLRVIDPAVTEAFSKPEDGRHADIVTSEMRDNGLDYLKEVARSFTDTSTVKCSAETGSPAEVIVDRAAAQTGTLIAMSTHGRSGAQRWLLGSVADKVLHASTSPLLLVRAREGENSPDEATLTTIDVPLDGSGLSELVLPHVTALAQKLNLEVVLLRAPVVPASSYMAPEYEPGFQEIAGNIMDESKKYLEEKVEQLQGGGVEKVSYVLLKGETAVEIIEMARQTPDNIVAMCTHGNSGIGRWVLGSVTDRVVRYSGDPVLVIRAPAEAK